ncbi:hypothetical protein OROMI_005322 [Orobanche minor]
MLYRTPQRDPFIFTLNPFSRSSSLSPRIQGMEFAQGGFKLGFEPETAAVNDSYGVSGGGGGGGGGAGDDFFVDELLDFSNGFSETEEPPPENEPENRKTCTALREKQEPPPPAANASLSSGDEFGSLRESELSSVQGEGLESLEWLSLIVDDSFPDYSFAGKFPPQATGNRAVPAAAGQEKLCFPTPVQTKARTKRARAGVRVRPVLSPSSAETSSSSSTSTTTSFSPPNGKRKKLFDGGGAVAAPPRRCAHCGITKTPQWRAGPLGPKTLCNACGVRHKSGRLLPEYRPACSPTFSTELHSNNHRKVLEMRRKKEVETEAAGLPLPVQSF